MISYSAPVKNGITIVFIVPTREKKIWNTKIVKNAGTAQGNKKILLKNFFPLISLLLHSTAKSVPKTNTNIVAENVQISVHEIVSVNTADSRGSLNKFVKFVNPSHSNKNAGGKTGVL